MQMSKYFSVLSAAALLAGATNLHAETEAQARAREALRQKMLELDAQQQSAPPRTAPARPVMPTSAPPPVEAAPRQPVAIIAAPAPAPAPAVPMSTPDDEAIARARAAVRQEIQNLNVQQQPAPRRAAPARPVVTTPAPPLTQPTPPPPVAPVVAPAPAAPVYTPPVAQDDEAIARARAALRQETHDPAVPAAAVTVRGSGKAPRSGTAVAFPEAPAPSVAPSIRSPEAPPSPIPATKELELAELLRKYRADEISPEDYHQQRAAILARP
ncbi:MAG: hypothetical protein KIS67_07585 [Verrucomicrobiae bacterium]|nr:hypothetical protein [Verrucomicrobiae bacterium]